VEIAVRVEDATADELRSLHQWLAGEEDLRGRVHLVQNPPQSGTLGTLPDLLQVVLANGGAGAVLAGAVVAWVRNRTTNVTVKLTRADGTMAEVSAERLRNKDAAIVHAVVADLSEALNPRTPQP
jgi:membrane-associated two-gene conflict system component 1 (EACC1)